MYTRTFSNVKHELCYAVKANSSHALLSLLAREGAGFDVNSRGELYRALRAGGNPSRMSMTGVGKSADDIRDGLRAGVGAFNVESAEECRRIQSIAHEERLEAGIMLRLNPDVNAATHPHISTGEAHHKFGLPAEEILALVEDLPGLPDIRFLGLAVHLGSQITDTRPFAEGLEKMFALAAEIQKRRDVPIDLLDIGGGMSVPYLDGDEHFPLGDLAKLVGDLLGKHGLGAVRIISEPGRYLVANAGILVSRVEYVKHTGGRVLLILDAGMNDLLRPALYAADHTIIPVTEPSGADMLPMSIFGPVCESSDTFAEEQLRPAVEEGDLVAILSAGAYAATMASTYNSRPLAAEAACFDGGWHLIRSRQTLEQLTENEHSLPGIPTGS
jgi:diaminopimelate decarboxylase